MDANEDDFWNFNERPKPVEPQTKKITYSSSSEDLNNNEQEGLNKSKHMKDKNAKEHIGEHHSTNENNRNEPDTAGIYEKLFQNLDRLKPRRFDESKLLEDQSSDDTDDNSNHQQNISTKNKSDGHKENHKNDSSLNSSDSDKESKADSSASSTGRKHVSRRKSQEQESSSGRKDRETLEESNGCQDHESAKREYNRGNQTSEDEKHSGIENGQKSKMKPTKKSRKAKKERSPSLSRSDRDLQSLLLIQNQHQFNAFDKSTKENICKWVKENNQLARKKRDEKRRADRQKKSGAEENTKSPDRISKKLRKRRNIPATRPRSSSDPGEERSRDAGVPRRSRSQPRTRRELRSGDFDWSTSKNDEIQSWLKEKTRLLRKKRAEEKKKRRMERKKKEEKQRQRDEKFADSFERVSEWMKQKMEQERLKRKQQKEEILREKERQEPYSTRRSADYHKLRPNNNLNPSFGLRAKGQEHPAKRLELPLLKQREKQQHAVLRNSAKHLDTTSSIIKLGKEDERRQLTSQRNSENLEEMSVNNETGIPNLQSPPARIHSIAKPGEQYPVRRSISLSRIRIAKETEKGNIGQTKLKKNITFHEWLGKKSDNELKCQNLERKKSDVDVKVPQNARLDITPSTEERVKDVGQPRTISSRRKAKNLPVANGNDSALVPNSYIRGGMDVLGTSLRAKSPKPEVDVRPQSSAVKYQRDSWNGFSDYLWDQVNEQEGGELLNSRDQVRLQVTSAETDKPKDNQQRMTVKNRGKVAKSSSLFEDKEGHDNFHELNETKTKDLKNETEKSNKVDRITPAHLLGVSTVHSAMTMEADLIRTLPTSEEEYNSKYSSLELDTGSAKDNGLNSYVQKSDIHTIIDADEEEFEPITNPKEEALDLENLSMQAKSKHIATQHADYEVLQKNPGPYRVGAGPYRVKRNESNTSDIEEDIASDFDVTRSKSSGSSL